MNSCFNILFNTVCVFIFFFQLKYTDTLFTEHEVSIVVYRVFLQEGNRSSKVNYFKDTQFILVNYTLV